jgi:hypothetical protein
MKPTLTLRLVLTHQWYDLTASGQKLTEYRAITPHWTRLIWDRREQITHVCFSRGYTAQNLTRRVERIDIGACPLAGWSGTYYRLHFAAA